MAVAVYYDRVKDTTTTTGTGTITGSGTAPTNYRVLSAVLSTNDTFYYAIVHQTAAEWEVGLGTYLGSNQFSRSAGNVLSGSGGAGSLVTFSAGTKDFWIDVPATVTSNIGQVLLASGNVSIGSSTFDIAFSGSFENYKVILNEINPSSLGAALGLRISEDSGSTYISSGGYRYTYNARDSTNTAISSGSNSATGVTLVPNISGGGAPVTMEVLFPHPATTSNWKPLLANWSTFDSSANHVVGQSGGAYTGGTSAVTNIRFFLSAGTYNSGRYFFYGLS